MLAKLKDVDLLKLEVAANQPRASALEDWIQRVTIRVGGLHRMMDGFFRTAVGVAFEAYDQYVQTQPIDRPMIQPRPNWHNDSKYLDIEFKLRSILLECVPESVRSAALATRQTSVVEVLFQTLVWGGPGTLRDKKSVLEAVERRGKGAVAPEDVHAALQRWMFDLVRLQRLQMQPPDPIVQIGVLRTMVGQMIEQSQTFQFRLNSFETLNSLSGAATATQQQVEKYWRYLAAESREMMDGVDQKQTHISGGVRAHIARLEAQMALLSADPKGKGKGKGKEAKGDHRQGDDPKVLPWTLATLPPDYGDHSLGLRRAPPDNGTPSPPN